MTPPWDIDHGRERHAAPHLCHLDTQLDRPEGRRVHEVRGEGGDVQMRRALGTHLGQCGTRDDTLQEPTVRVIHDRERRREVGAIAPVPQRLDRSRGTKIRVLVDARHGQNTNWLNRRCR